MTALCDTSALADLFVPSAHTPALRAWLKQRRPVLTVRDFAAGKCAAAMSRKHRLGELSVNDARRVLNVFDSWREAQTAAIATEAADIRIAGSFVRRFATKLALPAALHLAIASRLGCARLSFGQRQRAAAGMLGVALEGIG